MTAQILQAVGLALFMTGAAFLAIGTPEVGLLVLFAVVTAAGVILFAIGRAQHEKTSR
jgi:hypothetical protein